MTDDQEMRIYVEQRRWIAREFGTAVAKRVNYGWGVDGDEVASKIYGHGIVTSWLRDDGEVEHHFEAF